MRFLTGKPGRIDPGELNDNVSNDYDDDRHREMAIWPLKQEYLYFWNYDT